jgi:phosphate transport system substrate-binding protein
MRPLMTMTGVSALALASLLGGGAANAQNVEIRGQGATLPAGLYAAWFSPSFENGFAFTYNAPLELKGGGTVAARTGSGAGKGAFEAHVFNAGLTPEGAPLPSDISKAQRENISFGGSDAILTDADLDQYDEARWGEPIQVPSVGTPVTIAYNKAGLKRKRRGPTGVPGAKGSQKKGAIIYLSRASYCGIFTGEIATWNHPRIVADNGGAPSNQPIKVVVRSESSGTTEIFTRHLDTVCDGSQAAGGYTFPDTRPEGSGPNDPATGVTTFDWASLIPADRLILAAGSSGVSQAIANNKFAVGYVSPDYTNIVANPASGAGAPLPVPANLQNQFDIDNGVDPAEGGHSASWKNVKLAQQNIDAPELSDSALVWGRKLNLLDPQSNNPTAREAYPINGFTFLNFYTCYPKSRVDGVKALIAYYANPSTTSDADLKAKAANFAPLGKGMKKAIRDKTDSIRGGKAQGVCTL